MGRSVVDPGQGGGEIGCPYCDAVWAFANLGLTFWNWPPLRNDFVASISRRLGHRVRLVAGKL